MKWRKVTWRRRSILWETEVSLRHLRESIEKPEGQEDPEILDEGGGDADDTVHQ